MDITYDPVSSRSKREARVTAWLSPKEASGEPLKFESEAAQARYRDGITRFLDALSLERVPDRVPIMALGTFMQTQVYGVSARDALYDYEKLFSTHQRFLDEFQPDYYGSPAFVGSGRIFELLDLKTYRWPGHGSSEWSGYQCVEGEYMTAEDYPALIRDPSGFWLQSYLPRTLGALEPFRALAPLTSMYEIVSFSGCMIPFGLPPVQAALKALMDAGAEALKWVEHVARFDLTARRKGFSTLFGGTSKAPYDVLADTLRGTQGIMTDLFRRPDLVIQAMERLLPIYIEQGVAMATMSHNPLVFIPLHKGADGFLSDQQFAKFYWPTLRALLIGLINEGCIPVVFCEGSFNTRLDYLRDLPAGSSFWIFDRSDMVRIKSQLGNRICIGGNVPAGLLLTGSVDEVKACCRELIDRVGSGGGYVMSNGTAMDEVNAANLHAMIDFTREYGVYK